MLLIIRKKTLTRIVKSCKGERRDSQDKGVILLVNIYIYFLMSIVRYFVTTGRANRVLGSMLSA